MHQEPKRDQFERSVKTFWLALWGVWGLVFAGEFIGAVLRVPGAGSLWSIYWPCPLAGLNVATIGFLALWRHLRGRD